jgi:hypothetical protein
MIVHYEAQEIIMKAIMSALYTRRCLPQQQLISSSHGFRLMAN